MGSSSDGRRRHRSKDDRRDRESSSRRHEEEGRGSSGGNKLTEEERRLYDKARAYVEQKDKGKQSHKGRKKKSRDKYNSSDDDDDSNASSRRDRKRHRSSSHRERKKHHKRSRSSRDGDDRHEKHHKKKSSKHRHRDDDEEKQNKHSSSKRHKSSKHHDDSFRQKATKHSNTSKLVSLGDIVCEPPQELLDTDTNYFSHNSHLRLYLFRHYGIYFEELTSEESHDAFKEFVSKYNDGKLEAAYYDTIKGKLPQEALDQCQRTQHKWNFKTNKVELQSLKIVRDGVKKQTEYDADNNGNGGMMPRTQVTAARPKSDQSDEHKNRLSYDERRRSDKRHREKIKVGNEEMYGIGKADPGRERQIEKKREQANKMHGAARSQEVELDDKAIYGGEGGGDISYEAALAREKKYRERKEAAKHERTSELLKKEDDKQKNMLEMLGFSGLKPGEKIKIAPRQP
mmetsp:Transcript_12669/g.25321  ORF Transcript_12669/g.25321 Transcript_12669/m.25321 type:complete len:456 (-) Transcript_12669:63-1430(-)